MASGPQFLPEIESKAEIPKTVPKAGILKTVPKAGILKTVPKAEIPSVQQDAAPKVEMKETYFTRERENYFVEFEKKVSQPSVDRSPSTSDAVAANPEQTSNELARTIFYGAPSGKVDQVTALRRIKKNTEHTVFEVVWHGRPAVAKCWNPSHIEKFRKISSIYLKLYQKRPPGFRAFPSLYATGTICCSSLFPAGYVLVLAKVAGSPLRRWKDLPECKHGYVMRLKKAGGTALSSVGASWSKTMDILLAWDDKNIEGFLIL